MSLHYMFVKGDGMLNEGQREAIEKAVIAGNKLLLIQGPPGIWNAAIVITIVTGFVKIAFHTLDILANKMLLQISG